MSKYLIRIERAASKEYPSGDSECGYEIIGPLDASAKLDIEEWKADPESFSVKRFWRDEPNKNGYLVHIAGNAWHFSYSDPYQPEDPTFLLGSETFKVDEYVRVRDHDKSMHIFRIVEVAPIKAPEATI